MEGKGNEIQERLKEVCSETLPFCILLLTKSCFSNFGELKIPCEAFPKYMGIAPNTGDSFSEPRARIDKLFL